MKRRIVLLGPPASGKGTQAERIAAHYGLPAVSTGALLRREREEGSAIGREAESWTSQGRLFPDDIAMKVVHRWLSRVGASAYLFDGFPRTIGQAQAFDRELGANRPQAVLNLAVPDEVIRARVADRVTCLRCGATFSKELNHVREGERCPACENPLGRRLDDTPAALEERLVQHRQLTDPLLDYYGGGGRLDEIDARLHPEEVFSRIRERLEEAVPA